MANLTDLSVEELRARALVEPRFLSLACSRLACAKEALMLKDVSLAAKYEKSARAAFALSKENGEVQVSLVQKTAEIIRENGLEQAGANTAAGKHVVKVGMGRAGAIWQSHWTVR